MAEQESPNYLIVATQKRGQLIAAVSVRLRDGVWQCVGAPFYDQERMEWCQAIQKPHRPESRQRRGEVRLQEPGI